MIKGVNRQMIEVTHTGSPYFERAFLVVRTGSEPPSPQVLHSIADKVVQQADSYAGLRRQRRLWRWRRLATALLAAAGGAGILWIIEHLF